MARVEPKSGKQPRQVVGSMDSLPVSQRVTYRIARLQARLNAHAARLLRANSGMSPTEWRLLVMLDAHGDLTATEIVRLTQIDKGQVSRVIGSMTAAGFLEQYSDPSDLRVVINRMTPRGREVFLQARPSMIARHARISGCMSTSEARIFMDLLDRIDAVIDEEWE